MSFAATSPGLIDLVQTTTASAPLLELLERLNRNQRLGESLGISDAGRGESGGPARIAGLVTSGGRQTRIAAPSNPAAARESASDIASSFLSRACMLAASAEASGSAQGIASRRICRAALRATRGIPAAEPFSVSAATAQRARSWRASVRTRRNARSPTARIVGHRSSRRSCAARGRPSRDR